MSINSYLKSIEKFFLSRRVAVVLLIITLAFLLLSTRFPDVTTATGSPFFLILPLLIFLSILTCTLNRLRQRRIKPPDAAAFRFKKTLTINNGWDEARAVDYLVKKGWRYPHPLNRATTQGCPYKGEGGYMVMGKGGQGFWGSMVFHAGLLLMLTAAVITFATLFSAELLLTEGQAVPLGREGFLRAGRDPLWPVRMPEGEIVLERFKAVYEKEKFPVDYTATVMVKDNKGERFIDVKVNDPLYLGDLQYTIYRYGYAPGFLIKDGKGDVLFDGYVSLRLMDNTEDFFEIPGTDMTVYVRFFPDLVMTEDGPVSRSRVPNNPHFGLRIKKVIGEPGKGKMVKMGSSVEMEGLSIMPSELRYWAYFVVVRDSGKPILFVSIVLMTVGLIIRFIYHEKWLMIRYDATEGGRHNLEVSGFSRYFPGLFESEVEGIADWIGREKC